MKNEGVGVSVMDAKAGAKTRAATAIESQGNADAVSSNGSSEPNEKAPEAPTVCDDTVGMEEMQAPRMPVTHNH